MVNVEASKLTKPTDGPISRYINRKISTRITKYIVDHDIPVTPNQISIISFLLSLLSGSLFMLNNLVLGGIVTQVSSIIDGVDGELARALNKVSRFGGFLDAILDRLADTSIIIGLGFLLLSYNGYWHSFSTNQTSLLIISLALSGDIIVSYLHARAEASLGRSLHELCRVPVFASRDVRLFIIFIGGILQRPWETLLIIAILSYTYILVRLLETSILYYRGTLS